MPLMLMDETPDEAKSRISGYFSENLSGFRVFGNKVLVATYQRPEKTKSKLYLTDSTKGEDQYQGKIGLVIQMGPVAFVDDDKVVFHDKPQIGDWVAFKPAHGWPIDLDKPEGHCRVLSDQDIEGVVERPDAVW